MKHKLTESEVLKARNNVANLLPIMAGQIAAAHGGKDTQGTPIHGMREQLAQFEQSLEEAKASSMRMRGAL